MSNHFRFVFDATGEMVKDGDSVEFCYGVPSVRVVAKVVQRGDRLFALTPGHHPDECDIRRLRGYVGEWHKHECPHSEEQEHDT